MNTTVIGILTGLAAVAWAPVVRDIWRARRAKARSHDTLLLEGEKERAGAGLPGPVPVTGALLLFQNTLSASAGESVGLIDLAGGTARVRAGEGFSYGPFPGVASGRRRSEMRAPESAERALTAEMLSGGVIRIWAAGGVERSGAGAARHGRMMVARGSEALGRGTSCGSAPGCRVGGLTGPGARPFFEEVKSN